MNIFRRHKLYTKNITCLCNCVIIEHLLDIYSVHLHSHVCLCDTKYGRYFLVEFQLYLNNLYGGIDLVYEIEYVRKNQKYTIP